MPDPCYFDDSLPRLVRVLASKLDRAQIEAGVVLRDAGGRLCFFSDRDVAPATALEISAEIKAVLGPYARPDRLAVGSGEPGAQRVLQDPTALPVTVDLGDGEVLTVRYLDRRIVGADWLQPPSSPLEPAAPENEVAPSARTLRVAFSSLKGGVGRSTALTVVAAEQAQKGRNVLVIDLDLEAPGIGSLLLSEDRMPGFGAIDYLLERNFGAVDRAIVSDMVGTSALTQGHGLVNVVPAIGTRTLASPGNYLAKLSRAMIEALDDGAPTPLAGKLREMLAALEAQRQYDLVLIDVRAGLAEIAAGPILALDAEVLIFGTAQRQTLQALPRTDNTAPGSTIEVEKIVVVPSHRAALDPDRALVVGNRGVGKSFWTHALAEPGARAHVARTFRELATVDVVVGFNASSRVVPVAPTLAAINQAFTEAGDADALWRAILVRTARHLEIPIPAELPRDALAKEVLWVKGHGEQADRILTALDDQYASRRKKLVLVFDALDRLGTDWGTKRILTTALLKQALAAQSYRAIRLKLFVRRDQFEDPLLFKFADSSKIENARVDLLWTSSDLYTLLFARLSREAVSAEAFARLEKALKISGEPASDAAHRTLVRAIAGEFMGATAWGVVPTPVEIEVAVQPTPREFSGHLPEGTADEEDCQEDDVNGSHSPAAARHARRARMAEWLGRDLGALDLGVVMIDGVHIDEHVLLVALGIDADGKKHVLGVREGATENATGCTALLADLRDRGLRTDRPTLVVIDGSKALAKAVRSVFGERAIIQRCQAHKTRNVVDQLPDEMKPSVRQALRDAYAESNAERARTMLTNLVRRLRDDHPGAASSLEEGLDETLAVKRLRLSKKLERQLSTTNAIENLMGSVRQLSRRVKRWRGGKMILRWTVAAVADAATRFRRVTGAREGMTELMRALARHENAATGAARTKAAS